MFPLGMPENVPKNKSSRVGFPGIPAKKGPLPPTTGKPGKTIETTAKIYSLHIHSHVPPGRQFSFHPFDNNAVLVFLYSHRDLFPRPKREAIISCNVCRHRHVPGACSFRELDNPSFAFFRHGKYIN